MHYAANCTTHTPGGQQLLLMDVEKNPKPAKSRAKKPKTRLILIDRCPACGYLAVEQSSCQEGPLLQCNECPAAFNPRRNADDATMRSIAWVLPDAEQVSSATTVGLDARGRGDYAGVAGRTVAVIHGNRAGDDLQAVFEARAAYDAGAFDVRVVASAGLDEDMPGRLYLEWLSAEVADAVEGGAL